MAQELVIGQERTTGAGMHKSQSALGHQRRWTNVHVMSAYPATADKILQTMVGRSGQHKTADEFGDARGNSSFLQVKAFWLISLCKTAISWGWSYSKRNEILAMKGKAKCLCA
jgi:hypothetical protein